MAKKIILGAVSSMGIFKAIEKNLGYHGFDVINIVNDKSFKYPNLWSYIIVKLARLFGYKKLKKKLEQKIVFESILLQLEQYKDIDYALFLSAHTYSLDTLSFIRDKINLEMVNFQQDGINRYPDIWARIDYFSKFYVFDPYDLKMENRFLPTTNFYFDYDLAPQEAIYDFYFLGSHIQSRSESIKLFSNYAQKHNMNLKFDILCEKRHLLKLRKNIYKNNNINLILEGVDYETNLEIAKRSRVLVDFVINEHKGLSYRVFEALGFKKKLITTNLTIKDYDFYHPDNIFIWNGKDLDGLDLFLKKPYVEIDSKIREKYSFKNWINYVLDIKPHVKIDLPNL